MDKNYLQLIQFISEEAKISLEDVKRKIEAKQAKLSGLITKEGAAQIVASELGISFDRQLVKISCLVSGMRRINCVGKIIELSPIREFDKNGRKGRVVNLILADDTSNIQTVLWDENHIDLIFKKEIVEGDIIEINNATVRNSEIHLSSFSEIKLSNKIFEKIVHEKELTKKEIISFDLNERIMARAFIVRIFEPRFFEVCPECKRKLNELKECKEHGKIVPEKRALLNLVIDDGGDSIRTVIFAENLEKIIPQKKLEDPILFKKWKEEFLGKELLFSGQVRKNNLYGNKELIISKINEIDLDELIEELEN